MLPLFILDPDLLLHPETAPARVAFLLASLQALDHDLRQRGGRLLVRQGEPAAVLRTLVHRSRAAGVVAHVDHERLLGRVRDARVNRHLAAAGIPIQWLEAPGGCAALLTATAYREHWSEQMAARTADPPRHIPVPPPSDATGADDDPLADRPIPSLEQLGLPASSVPLPPAGSSAALALVQQFRHGPASLRYYWQLSYPAARVTTGLSPYLRFGVLSPRRCLQEIAPLAHDADPRRRRSWAQLTNRLRWASAISQRFRYLPQLELRPLWQIHDHPDALQLNGEQEELYQAWREGRTGFPIVDAAARCLLATGGWQELNFRTRAISASFLSHLCGLDWRWGALHYMGQLLDGDCPIDHYQWAMQAGCTQLGPGAWARIYHPGQVAVQRCDPQGLFIRRWLPELADLTNDQLGSPPAMAAYPAPILDYGSARELRRRQLESLAHQGATAPTDWTAALSPLPTSFQPFAAERFTTAPLGWCSGEGQELFPAALDPQQLDARGRRALASWFLTPSSGSGSRGAERGAKAAGSGRSRRSRPADPGAPQQLSLWDD